MTTQPQRPTLPVQAAPGIATDGRTDGAGPNERRSAYTTTSTRPLLPPPGATVLRCREMLLFPGEPAATSFFGGDHAD